MKYHNPVLLNESITGLAIHKNGTYVDATYGGGGHSAKILETLGLKGKLFAFDQDTDALENVIDDARFLLLNNNFRYIKNFLKYHNAVPVDGILADLGVSSHQFDSPERGFSTRFSSSLDMRMKTDQELTAKDILNTYDENRLSEIFKNYGELQHPLLIARSIIKYRFNRTIETTDDLKIAIQQHILPKHENKFLAQVFQALRIEVNDEIESLKEFLTQGASILKQGGRMVIISYHSLEDRLVKNFFKSGNFSGEVKKDFFGKEEVPFKQITKKPVIPCEKEILENNRARSAKLRIAEKI